MIIGFLLNVIYAFIAFLLGLLPSGSSLPSEWVSAVYSIWGYINSFSFIVPVTTLVLALSIAMGFHLFVLGWKALHWLYALIRGSRVH